MSMRIRGRIDEWVMKCLHRFIGWNRKQFLPGLRVDFYENLFGFIVPKQVNGDVRISARVKLTDHGISPFGRKETRRELSETISLLATTKAAGMGEKLGYGIPQLRPNQV